LTGRGAWIGLVALLAASACSQPALGPSPTDPPPTATTVAATTTSTLKTAEAVARFEACLADRGVDIEPVPFDASGRPRLELVMRGLDFSSPETADALTACAEPLSAGALRLDGGSELREGVVEALAAFSRCVRARGAPGFPDPRAAFDGVGAPFPADEIPLSDPDLGQAVSVCAERLK